MRRAGTILVILAGLFALHGAAWFFLSRAVRDRVDAAVAGANGADLKVGSRELAGYPFAAGVAWGGVEAGPAGLPLGSRLATGRLVLAITMLPPWSLRIGLPDPVRLTMPDGAVRTFAAADARITAPCCHPAEFALAANDAVLSVGSAPVARIARLTGTMRPGARTIAMSAAGLELMSGGAPLAPRVATASATLTLEGPSPPAVLPAGQAGIDALIAWRDGGGAVRLDRAAIGWGPVDAEGEGRFTLDPLLQPAATGQARIAGGSEALDTMAAAGLLAPRAAQAARAVLGLLPTDAAPVGPGQRPAIRVPITLADGRVSLGGFPVLRVRPWTLP